MDIDVTALSTDQLSELSDDQVRFVQNIGTQRLDKKLVEQIKESLKGRDAEIVEEFTRPPFVYVSPEIEVVPGFRSDFDPSTRISPMMFRCTLATSLRRRSQETWPWGCLWIAATWRTASKW